MFERYSCFFLLLWKQKHILSHAGLTPSRWMLPIEARRTKMTRTLAPELPAECGAQQPAPLVPELLQYLLYSLAREQKCARTDCDKGFRQAGDSSISHYLARLVGVWWRGGGFAPSLHDKPLDVYPLQLISHSQQIRHIRCCFGRGRKIQFSGFYGFYVAGACEGRSVLCSGRMAGEAGGYGARAKQVQHNTVKPIPVPLFPDERGLTWQGALHCNWAMLERRRPTCATRSGRTIV